ncbi:MAG: fatty-acid--CoA ligase FadD8 [Acidimicrobiales bacterium]
MGELQHRGATYGEILTESLRRHGDTVAFIDQDDSTMTFRAALDLFGRFRAVLAGFGITRGSAIGMLSTNRTDGWLAQWAGPANGARYTPMHPYASFDDHLYIAQDSDLSVLIVDPLHHLERGRLLAEQLPGVTILTLGPADYGQDLLALAREVEPLIGFDPDLDPEDLAMIIYTGGTTGRSKGVMQTHRAIIANHTLQLAEWPFPKTPRFLALAPYSHATGWFLLGVLWRGGTVIMRNGFTVDGYIDAVERLGANMTFAVPTMIYTLLDDPRITEHDLSSMELIVYGAAPMSVPRLRQGIGLFGPVFLQLYGQSEAPNVVTTLLPDDHDLDDELRLASCGRPAPGMTVKVLGSDDVEVPRGEVGELCIRGPLVMQGYHNKPEQTAETIRDGWLRTSDLALQDDDGYIRLVGRAKDMIISGGFNVYPAEVEAPILMHPGVEAVAVVGLPDDKWGEAVTAFVVPKPGMLPDPEEIIALVREKKGSVLAPKAVHYIDTIPVTSLGKPDKKVLRDWKPVANAAG